MTVSCAFEFESRAKHEVRWDFSDSNRGTHWDTWPNPWPNEPAAAADTVRRVTTREKLHQLVDELSEAEAEAALVRLERERVALQRWAQDDDADSAENASAEANAREAIREEPW